MNVLLIGNDQFPVVREKFHGCEGRIEVDVAQQTVCMIPDLDAPVRI